MNAKAEIHEALSRILARHVVPLFVPGIKLTILARLPGNDEADVMVSDDGIDELMALIQRSALREPKETYRD